MKRLPRAEDHVVLFIAVDGEPLRAEGRISRITLENTIRLDRGTGGSDRRVRGTVTIELESMREIEPDTVEVRDAANNVVIVHEIPPGVQP